MPQQHQRCHNLVPSSAAQPVTVPSARSPPQAPARTLTITAEALLAARVAKVARRDKLLLAQARQDRHRNGWLRQLAKAGLIDGVCWVVPRDSLRLQA